MQSGSARAPLIIAGVAALATYVAIGHHGPVGFLQTIGLLHHHTASANVMIDDDMAQDRADESQKRAERAQEKAQLAQAKAERAMAAIPPIPAIPALPPVPDVPGAIETREVAPFDKIELTEMPTRRLKSAIPNLFR